MVGHLLIGRGDRFVDMTATRRKSVGGGSLGGSSSIDHPLTRKKHPPTTHTHTHTPESSHAGILTLSGNEVVGSMVALKERTGVEG